mmetsp:Transcript_93283/g.200208  ORF Transcript_93283/g.200208 Transcript_93283/m.200208 type:complete len:117 (-) Transcript_93283:127-477(-)
MAVVASCLKGCWNECGKKCIVDEDEIEIVGPLRQFSSGSGWVPDWISRTGSALCTPRRFMDIPQNDAEDRFGAFGGGAFGASAAGLCTGPFPTPRSAPRSAAASRLASRNRTPRGG